MVEIVDVSMGYGDISFTRKIEAVPGTSETTGNVTINNAGTVGKPSHFDTSFMISADAKVGDVEFTNIFHWKVVVLADSVDVPYSEVEEQAARQISPMLRAVADNIDQQLAEYDEKKKAKKETA